MYTVEEIKNKVKTGTWTKEDVARCVEELKQMVRQVEPMMGAMPADKKPMMQYILQEVKKEIAKKGG